MSIYRGHALTLVVPILRCKIPIKIRKEKGLEMLIRNMTFIWIKLKDNFTFKV